jgi:predicted lipid carrier protein YhbT
MLAQVPSLPPILQLVARPLPLLPLQMVFSSALARILAQHPRIFARMGEHAGKAFGLAPTDLPFGFVLRTPPGAARVTAVRQLPGSGLDAVIRGPISALLGMVNGDYDGDALFFARIIVVEGDVEAVLALRNAVDDAGIDLLGAFLVGMGPLEQPARMLLPHTRDLVLRGLSMMVGSPRDARERAR